MRTAVASTSRDAYHALGPKLGDQQRQIVAYLAKHCHRDWTRGELAEGTGIRLASICGRVAELIATGTIEELPRRPDRLTRIAAHPLRLVPLQAELFNEPRERREAA